MRWVKDGQELHQPV
jgi:hypothetical protein